MAQTTIRTRPLLIPPRFRFSREAPHQMAQLGLIEDKRVELIEGEVIKTPPSTPEYFETGDTLSVRGAAFRLRLCAGRPSIVRGMYCARCET